jgi:hypothetical protein
MRMVFKTGSTVPMNHAGLFSYPHCNYLLWSQLYPCVSSFSCPLIPALTEVGATMIAGQHLLLSQHVYMSIAIKC